MLILCMGFIMTGCQSTEMELNGEVKEATEITKENNAEIYTILDFEDEAEKENAERGLIYAPDSLEIKDDEGNVIWSQDAYAFLDNAEAPDTVNPSLWRNAQLNHIYGLFEVTDGIYQVRGYDMTNITFVEGETGWIVFDPMMSAECAKASMQLVNEQLGERPITGIVISHPHVDHYGGIKGIVSEEDVTTNNIPIIVPEGFEEYTVSENLYSGIAMQRRTIYQYGSALEKSETGTIAMGIGLGQSTGISTYISPNDVITETGEIREVDGITMEFQMTPGTEAPAEMNTWFPDKNALWIAENCTGTMHNLYTLRGAEVRDGNAWAEYIMETEDLYGDKVEVVFQSHNWPHFGNEQIKENLLNTAAVYKFINDQTLLYINQGYTEDEIANMIELPEELNKVWYTRQYYGTVAHNAKAVYQKYMGWYDANPVNLDLLPKTESAQKFVEYMGGDVDKILEMAMADFEEGEYQWVAEITNILVYQDPTNEKARYLCADALEQLGYQAESGTWRNAYLTGAKELREGTLADEKYLVKSSGEMMGAMTPEMALEYLGIIIDSNAAEEVNLKMNLVFTDEASYLVTVKNGVLLYQKNATSEEADVTLTMPNKLLLPYMQGNEQAESAVQTDGDIEAVEELKKHLVSFDTFFEIIEP